MLRPITSTITAQETAEGAGAVVRRAIPHASLRSLDPFVLLDEFLVEPPASFPEHPHRGFEIVTYLLEGSFRHRDSMGNDSTVDAGGLQKINTGAGIWHSEMPRSSGLNRGLQLWINLPHALKQGQPEYEGVPADRIPEQTADGSRTRIVVGAASPVSLHTPVLYLDVALQPESSWEWEVPPDYSGAIYVLSGGGHFGAEDTEGRPGQLLVLGEGDRVRARAKASEPLRFVLFAGRPHGEPIRIRGSFVE